MRRINSDEPHPLRHALEHHIRAVAAAQGDNPTLYVRWFTNPAQATVVSRVCQNIVAHGVQRLDCATFSAEWDLAASALGKRSSFRPQHFDPNARHRYGTKGRVGARVFVTAYPPFVLADGFLTLNPVVREAVRILAEERRDTIVMLREFL